MKKLLATALLFIGFTASANVISIDVSETQVEVGEVVTVSITGSNFDFFDVFDLNFNFDTSLFSYDATTLDSGLPFAFDPIFPSLTVSEQTFGLAISFLEFTGIAGSGLIASFDLTAIAQGISSFSFSDVLFSDTFLQTELDVDFSDAEQVKVSAPVTLGLFGLSALVMFGLRRNA